MSSEAGTAFYKGVKFWFTLLLAGLIAALLWRLWRGGDAADGVRAAAAPGALSSGTVSTSSSSPGQRVSNMR